ncbi:MAG: hypothetical protein Q9160_008194 [Pyrenula sp. 1 TL-2023]
MSAPNPLQNPQNQGKEEKKGYYATSRDYVAGTYNNQYENWMPWIEDKYLSWFGKDNKASYAAKDSLSKTKVTGISQVDKLQDGVNDLAAGQVGKGGLAQPLGDALSKEGINRAERGGKDDEGRMVPGSGSAGPLGDGAEGLAKGGKTVGGGVASGVKGAGGYVGGMFGGGGGKEEKK